MTNQRTPLLIELSNFTKENRLGRNPYEGYQRGYSLMFPDVVSAIMAEPDYQDAITLAHERSVVLHNRLMNLYLLIRFFLARLAPGHIIEFGSFRGGSAMFLAKLAQKYLPGTQVYALDTFAGMPPTDKAIDVHNSGDFSNTNIEEIRGAADAAGLNNLHLIKGLFDQTTPGLLIAKCNSIRLVHIDCDIYRPAIYAWNQIKPVMVPGGYIVFDDATEASCLGATEAVEEIIHRDRLRSEQISPHFVFRYPPLV